MAGIADAAPARFALTILMVPRGALAAPDSEPELIEAAPAGRS